MMLYFAADSTNVIQIGTVESVVGILAIVLAVGIAWGTLRTKVVNIDKDVDEIKKDTKAFTSDIAAIKTIVYREYQSKYAKQNSPRQLTEKGLHVLEKSGIRDVIDANKIELIEKLKARKPETAYDAENCVLEIVSDFVKSNEQLLNTIKEKTFTLGETVDIVLFVGGIYFRDYALPEIGFNVVDIDKKP